MHAHALFRVHRWLLKNPENPIKYRQLATHLFLTSQNWSACLQRSDFFSVLFCASVAGCNLDQSELNVKNTVAEKKNA